MTTRGFLLSTSVTLAAVIAGCSSSRTAAQHPMPRSPSEPSADRSFALSGPAFALGGAPSESYPDLATLYAKSIYRTCAANGGVCHNDKEYPNLSTLGAVTQAINQPCNVTREDPREIHDLCERRGDAIFLNGETLEIASVVMPKKKPVTTFDEDNPNPKVKLVLRSAPNKRKMPKATHLLRPQPKGLPLDLGEVDLLSASFTTKGSFVELRPRYEGDALKVIVPGFEYAEWGGATDPQSLHLGDPNHNGVFGGDLGGGLIVPGRPDRSYILTRLTDPSAGPLMPRANCCAWSKASLRALYCWIAGLEPNGDNALAPINYASCPSGPVEDVAYPEPGPSCETSGMCPVMPRSSSTSGPSGERPLGDWSLVWKKVLQPRCAGCHGDANRAELDLKNEALAFRAVTNHVVPKQPDKSELYIRVSPDLCKAPSCTLMPMKGPPLDPDARTLIRRWIERGARRTDEG